MVFHHQEEKQIILFAKIIPCLEIKKELEEKDGSKAMYDLAQPRTWEFAINTEDTVLKFKFNLCSKIKQKLGLELWTVFTSLSEKPCRSKRKRKLRGNPLQKRDQDWNRHQQVVGTCTPTEQRKWIDIAIQESKDPYCFQVSKIHDSITSTQSTS